MRNNINNTSTFPSLLSLKKTYYATEKIVCDRQLMNCSSLGAWVRMRACVCALKQFGGLNDVTVGEDEIELKTK